VTNPLSMRRGDMWIKDGVVYAAINETEFVRVCDEKLFGVVMGMDCTGSCPNCGQHIGNSAGYCTCHGRVPEQPFTCPVCAGSGKVSRPPHVAGDVVAWTGSGSELYDCRACAGTGVLWR
jgi:hypothetical protein